MLIDSMSIGLPNPKTLTDLTNPFREFRLSIPLVETLKSFDLLKKQALILKACASNDQELYLKSLEQIIIGLEPILDSKTVDELTKEEQARYFNSKIFIASFKGDKDEALKYLAKATTKLPEIEEYKLSFIHALRSTNLKSRSKNCYQRGLIKQLSQHLERFENSDSKNRNSRDLLKLLLEAKREEEANEFLIKSLENKGNSFDLRYALVTYYCRRRLNDLGLEKLIELSEEFDPNDYFYNQQQEELGKTAIGLGKYDIAKEAYKVVMKGKKLTQNPEEVIKNYITILKETEEPLETIEETYKELIKGFGFRSYQGRKYFADWEKYVSAVDPTIRPHRIINARI